jgi:hypothetical protein
MANRSSRSEKEEPRRRAGVSFCAERLLLAGCSCTEVPGIPRSLATPKVGVPIADPQPESTTPSRSWLRYEADAQRSGPAAAHSAFRCNRLLSRYSRRFMAGAARQPTAETLQDTTCPMAPQLIVATGTSCGTGPCCATPHSEGIRAGRFPPRDALHTRLCRAFLVRSIVVCDRP